MLKLKRRHFVLNVCLILIISVLILGCHDNEVEPPLTNTSNIQEQITDKEALGKDCFEKIQFTEAELKYLEDLKEIGQLTIATRYRVGVYYLDEAGQWKGIHYQLMKNFTDQLGIALNIKEVEFLNYFEIDGVVPPEVKSDENYSYVPDLMNEVDVYMDSITVLPWREKLFDFVEIYPVKQMIVSRKGMELKEIKELEGKKIILLSNSSYETRLKEIIAEYDLDLDIEMATDAMETYESVADGNYDVTISDSDLGILTIGQFDNISISLAISEYEHIGWGVGKEDVILKSILDKYIQYTKDCGLINQIWMEEYNMSYIEYSRLLGGIE